jgi:hypothetical protein
MCATTVPDCQIGHLYTIHVLLLERLCSRKSPVVIEEMRNGLFGTLRFVDRSRYDDVLHKEVRVGMSILKLLDH